MTALMASAGLCVAAPPEPAGKIVILFDESASMNKHNVAAAAKLWIETFIRSFTKPYQISLAGFSETALIHAEASIADPAQVVAMLKKVERLQARAVVSDLEKPFAYLAQNKDAITLAILITGGGGEIWDDKSGYLSRTIRYDDRYANLNAIYRRMRDVGASRKERRHKLSKKYVERNQELIGQWLSVIKDSPTLQLIALDVSGSNAHIKSWARQVGGGLVVADMKSHDPQAAARLAFSTLQEKAAAAIDEPLPTEAAEKKERGSPPSPTPVPSPTPAPAPAVAPTPLPAPSQTDASIKASTPGQKSPRWELLTAIVAGLLVCAVFFIKRKCKPAQADTPAEVPPNGPVMIEKTEDKLPEAPRHIGAEIEKTEEASVAGSPRDLMAHLWHGAFDRRSSIRILAQPGTIDVVWRGADGGEHRGAVSGISWRTVMFGATNHRDETIVAVLHHPTGHRFGIQSYRIEERDNGQKIVMIEKFADTITDRMNWIELLTRLDSDQ
jgi:hypothetical protein